MPTILFISPPGRGKTAAIRAFAAHQGRHLEVLVPSLRQPEDILGLPEFFVSGRGRRVATVAIPAWADRLWENYERGVLGILYIDELTTARPAMQAALLGLLATGETDSWGLPPKCWLIAAANPPDCAAGGLDLEPPAANRLIWRQWPETPLHEWLSAGPRRFRAPIPHPILDAPETPLILSGDNAVSDAGLARAWALIGAYITARPSSRHAMPADMSRRSGPWPSERSWHMAAVCIAACLDAGRPLEVAAEWVGGCVGDSVALEWLAMARSMALPSIADILSGAIRWSAAAAARDVAYAVSAELASLIEAQPDPARVERALGAIIDGPRDVVAPAVGRIARAGKQAGWRPAGAIATKLAKYADLLK